MNKIYTERGPRMMNGAYVAYKIMYIHELHSGAPGFSDW